jgi:hypothetical protein
MWRAGGAVQRLGLSKKRACPFFRNRPEKGQALFDDRGKGAGPYDDRRKRGRPFSNRSATIPAAVSAEVS